MSAKTDFTGITTGTAVDSGTPNSGLPFSNHRQVTGRNTPPAVNAVFNYANFWDGRANNIFNGSSPIGPLDVNAGIWINNSGTLVAADGLHPECEPRLPGGGTALERR